MEKSGRKGSESRKKCLKERRRAMLALPGRVLLKGGKKKLGGRKNIKKKWSLKNCFSEVEKKKGEKIGKKWESRGKYSR